MCLVVFPYLQHFRFFAVDGWGLLIELDSVSTLLCRKNKSWNYNYAKDVQNTKFIFRIFPTLSALTEVRTGRTDRSLRTTNKLFSKVLAQKENHQIIVVRPTRRRRRRRRRPQREQHNSNRFRLAKQTFALASRFFAHFSAVLARPQHENA